MSKTGRRIIVVEAALTLRIGWLGGLKILLVILRRILSLLLLTVLGGILGLRKVPATSHLVIEGRRMELSTEIVILGLGSLTLKDWLGKGRGRGWINAFIRGRKIAIIAIASSPAKIQVQTIVVIVLIHTGGVEFWSAGGFSLPLTE